MELNDKNNQCGHLEATYSYKKFNFGRIYFQILKINEKLTENCKNLKCSISSPCLFKTIIKSINA